MTPLPCSAAVQVPGLLFKAGHLRQHGGQRRGVCGSRPPGNRYWGMSPDQFAAKWYPFQAFSGPPTAMMDGLPPPAKDGSPSPGRVHPPPAVDGVLDPRAEHERREVHLGLALVSVGVVEIHERSLSVVQVSTDALSSCIPMFTVAAHPPYGPGKM